MAKILVVDDSNTLRQMVGRCLESSGHDVLQAEDGEAALRWVEQQSVDLILSDMYMPGMDGISLAQQLRSRTDCRHTPILILSTDSSPESKNRGRNAGVTGWITKPFDPLQLESVVQQVLA